MELAELNKKSMESDAHPIKVLVADDDAPTRILLRAAVSQWGYEVVEASDGEEAWNLLQQPNTPELIIVDWLMPKLDGIDLCRRIKNELKISPYIILLTQLSGTTNIVKGLEAGANEFLSKPFNMAELQSRLSVGARIVRYKEKLQLKHLKLQQYGKEVEELVKMLTDIANKQQGNEVSADLKKAITLLDELNRELQQDNGGE